MALTMTPTPAAAHTITLADYDPDWPRQFEEERERLQSAIGKWAAGIEVAL